MISGRPFRFLHASDFHLERPLFGLTAAPEHLREVLIEAPFRAACRVFDEALAREVDFVVLSGDILDVQATGPRGPLFLVEQLERLAQRDVQVYWAGGTVDPPEHWPETIPLPDNVHVFASGKVDEFVFSRDGEPLVRLIGLSHEQGRKIRAADFHPDPTGLFSLAVIHGSGDQKALQPREIGYWALGGRNQTECLFDGSSMAHFPGAPQGRHPEEVGAHGCLLVHVDSDGGARATHVATDVVRWSREEMEVSAETDMAQLEMLLRNRLVDLLNEADGRDLLVRWRVTGDGPLLQTLRQEPLAAALLAKLQSEFGHKSPAAWSTTLDAQPRDATTSASCDDETFLGDFLRATRRLQQNEHEDLQLETLLDDEAEETLRHIVELQSTQARNRVLSQAAALGADLLGAGEERQS